MSALLHPTGRRKERRLLSAVERKLATETEAEDMAEQESIGLSYSETQGIDSQVNSISEQIDELCNQTEMSTDYCGSEEERVDCEFDYISQQTEDLFDKMASFLREIKIASISEHKIMEMRNKMISKFKSISKHIEEETLEPTKDLRMAADCHLNQKTEEEEEITMEQPKDFKMSKFKSETSILEPADSIPDYKWDTEDEEEMMEEEGPCYILKSYSLPDDDDDEEEEEDRGKSATETEFTKSAREGLTEEEYFADYRSGWDSTWGSRGGQCGRFQDMTLLSPMYFTHCTPGRIPVHDALDGSTLQIYSIKIAEVKGDLNWPLCVYGVVAARDIVDQNRNLLFCRQRNMCQKLTQEDPFLRLTGPSRAIVSTDPVDFEIQLKVKGRTKSRDRALISLRFHCTGIYRDGLSTVLFDNRSCTTEFSFERLERTVQATILGVRVVQGGSRPFQYGGRVACSSPPQDDPSRQVVLLDSHGGAMPTGSDGYLHLSRHVVSVELQCRDAYDLEEFKESLKVVIHAYSPSGDIAAQGHVYFLPKYCNISQGICDLGDSKVEITVAWSLLVQEKRSILAKGWVDTFDGVNMG